jgi:hypothetical protein
VVSIQSSATLAAASQRYKNFIDVVIDTYYLLLLKKKKKNSCMRLSFYLFISEQHEIELIAQN